jgi:hypothetical protein
MDLLFLGSWILAGAGDPLFLEDVGAFRAGAAPEAQPLRVATTCGTPRKDYIIEVNGGGLALADFDGDGDSDLVVVDGSTLERVREGQSGFPPRLFLNDGAGRFAPAGESWAMSGGTWGMGCAVGDLDGDGWLDLVVTQWGPCRVFVNRQGQGFEERTGQAGLPDARWASSAALADLDRDEDLDLAVICYLAFDPASAKPPGGGCRWKGHDVMCGPEGLEPVHDLLYAGKGDGTFEDVTLARGFRPLQAGFGLGVACLDHDLDGDVDLFVANDSTPNFLWQNDGSGKFEEVGLAMGAAVDRNGKEQASMGIAVGDMNGDGRQDLFVTNFSGENNALYRSRSKAGFREDSSPLGLGGPSISHLGWGTTFADYDLDGDLDLHVLNGHVYPQADSPGTDTTYAQPDHLYRFSESPEGPGRYLLEPLRDGPPRVSRASSVADIDGDGDLDIVAIELDGPVRVYRNQARERHPDRHWLAVAPRSAGKNRFALGARVVVEWEGGKRAAEVHTAGGFQSAVPPLAHFGLAGAERAKRLTVRFPSGREVVREDVPADRLLVVEEPAP